MRPLPRAARYLGLAVLGAVLMPGCSEAPAPPAAPAATVQLSTGNADANAPAVTAFFRATCLEAGGDAGAFAEALRSAGWEQEQVQVPSGAMPIAAWRLAHGELVRSALSLGPGANFIDCELRLDPEVAPSPERMRDALRPVVNHPTVRALGGPARQTTWRWRPSPREERDLTIAIAAAGRAGGGAAGRHGLRIHLGISEVPPPPPIPDGTENVQ